MKRGGSGWIRLLVCVFVLYLCFYGSEGFQFFKVRV